MHRRWYEAARPSGVARGYRRRSVTTNIADALGVSLGGVAQKRGLIPRVPDGERLLADAAVWLTGEYPDAVRSTHQHTTGDGDAALSVDLHPAAPPFALTANDDGRVTAAAETGVAGPGYHRFVGRVLERLGAELAIDWTDGDGAAAFADRKGAERLYLGWLGPQLAKARVRVRRGERGVHWGCRRAPASRRRRRSPPSSGRATRRGSTLRSATHGWR